MYVPEHFAPGDAREALDLVDGYPFGTLVSQVDGAPFATHLPFLLEQGESPVLRGHFARANPHWRQLEGARCLAIFNGPHAYVSPTWYDTQGVPTWNYAAVHVYGTARVVADQEELVGIIHALSDRFEQHRDQPWVPDYPASMLRGIVGFEISVDTVEAKFKLSQNRPAVDRQNVCQQLAASSDSVDRSVAELMRRAEPPN